MREITDLISDGVEVLQELKPVLAGIAVLGTLVAVLGSDDSSEEADVSLYESETLKQQEKVLFGLQQEKKKLEEGQDKKRQQQIQVEDSLRQAEELVKEICQYRYELFMPGAVEDIQNAIAQASDFLKKGAGQSALSEACHACQMAQMTIGQLIGFEIEWEKEYKNFIKSGIRADMFFKQCAAWEIYVQTTEGKERVEIDVDYWTKGKLQEIYGKIPRQQISRECCIVEIQERTAETEEIIGQMRTLSETAAEAFLDSQVRAEQCETVYQALIKRGWVLENDSAYGYENRDNRNNVILRMKNGVQDRMELVFGVHGSFRVSARFRDAGNLDFQKHLADLLYKALTEDGFTLTDLQVLTA